MPIWINAIGVGCLGCVYGYILFYSIKRHHQPITDGALSVKETLSVLAAIGAGGAIGAAFISLEGVNYIGPYGIGALLGLISNVTLTLWLESSNKNRRMVQTGP